MPAVEAGCWCANVELGQASADHWRSSTLRLAAVAEVGHAALQSLRTCALYRSLCGVRQSTVSARKKNSMHKDHRGTARPPATDFYFWQPSQTLWETQKSPCSPPGSLLPGAKEKTVDELLGLIVSVL